MFHITVLPTSLPYDLPLCHAMQFPRAPVLCVILSDLLLLFTEISKKELRLEASINHSPSPTPQPIPNHPWLEARIGMHDLSYDMKGDRLLLIVDSNKPKDEHTLVATDRQQRDEWWAYIRVAKVRPSLAVGLPVSDRLLCPGKDLPGI